MPQVPQLTADGGAATLNLPRPTPDTFGASGFHELARTGEHLDILAAQQLEREQRARLAAQAAQEKYDEKVRVAASNMYVSRTLIAQDALLSQTETQLLKDHVLEPWKIGAAYQEAFDRNLDSVTKDLTDPLLKGAVIDSLQDDFRKKSEKVRLLEAMMVQQQGQVALTNELGYRRSEFLGATSSRDRLGIALKITETLARQVNVLSTKEDTSKLLASTIHGLYVDTASDYVEKHPNEFLTGGLPADMDDVKVQLTGEELHTLKGRAATAQTAQLKRDEALNQSISEQVELKTRLSTYDPDPAQRLTSKQVEETVSQLVGRPGAMRATEAAKIVEETRALEQKRGPENITAHNEMKALIDADPSQVSPTRDILANGLLSQSSTRELLAYHHTKLLERAKADHFTNQPRYKDQEDQLRLDYETSLFGIPTKTFTRAHARLEELTNPKGAFKRTPDEAYAQIRKEIPVSIGVPPLKMLNERVEQGIKQYETGMISVQDLAKMAVTEPPGEQVKLLERIRAIDKVAEQEGFTELNKLKPKEQKKK